MTTLNEEIQQIKVEEPYVEPVVVRPPTPPPPKPVVVEQPAEPKDSPPKKPKSAMPKGLSDVDKMIWEYENENGDGQFLFDRQGPGSYKFGTRKCTAKISNGVCLIRVGGGYMEIDEFYKLYSD